MSPLIFLAWMLVVFITCVLFLGLILVSLEQFLKLQILRKSDSVDAELMQYLADWEHEHDSEK